MFGGEEKLQLSWLTRRVGDYLLLVKGGEMLQSTPPEPCFFGKWKSLGSSILSWRTRTRLGDGHNTKHSFIK